MSRVAEHYHRDYYNSLIVCPTTGMVRVCDVPGCGRDATEQQYMTEHSEVWHACSAEHGMHGPHEVPWWCKDCQNGLMTCTCPPDPVPCNECMGQLRQVRNEGSHDDCPNGPNEWSSEVYFVDLECGHRQYFTDDEEMDY